VNKLQNSTKKGDMIEVGKAQKKEKGRLKSRGS